MNNTIGENEPVEITDAQKEAVRKTLAFIEQHPGSAKPWDEVKKKYSALNKRIQRGNKNNN